MGSKWDLYFSVTSIHCNQIYQGVMLDVLGLLNGKSGGLPHFSKCQPACFRVCLDSLITMQNQDCLEKKIKHRNLTLSGWANGPKEPKNSKHKPNKQVRRGLSRFQKKVIVLWWKKIHSRI